jgi:hypothetical protein
MTYFVSAAGEIMQRLALYNAGAGDSVRLSASLHHKKIK